MPSDQPIACTLTAAEMPKRLADIRAIGDAYLRAVSADASTAVLRFSAKPDARERLEAIVVAESRCCAFLEFDLEHTTEAVVLTIRAPEGGELVMHQLVEAFGGASPVTA